MRAATTDIRRRLAELSLELPGLGPPKYAYEPVVKDGEMLYVSGQISRTATGEILTGRLGGGSKNAWVACTADAVEQPEVVDGASQLLIDVLGDAGRHARTALPAPVLPKGALVELDATVAVSS